MPSHDCVLGAGGGGKSPTPPSSGRVYGWIRGELGWDRLLCPASRQGSHANPGGLQVLGSEHRTCLGGRTNQRC